MSLSSFPPPAGKPLLCILTWKIFSSFPPPAVTPTGYEPGLRTLITLFGHCLPFLDTSVANPSLRPIQQEVFESIRFPPSSCCLCPSLRPLWCYTAFCTPSLPPSPRILLSPSLFLGPSTRTCPKPSPSNPSTTNPSLSTCLTPIWTSFLSLMALTIVSWANFKPRETLLPPLPLPPLQMDPSPPLWIPLLTLYGMQTQEHPLI